MARSRKIALAVAWSCLFAALVALGIVALVASRATPALTPQSLAAAKLAWRERGPADYDLDITVRGRQPGEVRISVRDGEVTSMTRDGRSPSQRRTWDYWSVDGQFGMIDQELLLARDPVKSFGAAEGTNVTLRAEFDQELGYPRRFQRSILGLDMDMEWEITRFAAIEPDAAGP